MTTSILLAIATAFFIVATYFFLAWLRARAKNKKIREQLEPTHEQLKGQQKCWYIQLDSDKGRYIMNEAITHHGGTNQVLKTVEELAELAAEILHYHIKGDDHLHKVREEMADVFIMLQQLRTITEREDHLTPSVEFYIDMKLRRLADSLGLKI